MPKIDASRLIAPRGSISILQRQVPQDWEGSRVWARGEMPVGRREDLPIAICVLKIRWRRASSPLAARLAAIPRGVTVTQRPLEALFMVQIHAG